MDDQKKTDLVVPFIQSDLNLKSYYCPHCKKMIMKGNVKRLSMTCPHCSKLIRAVENDLLKTETDEA